MLKGWKTLAFGLSLAVFGALEKFDFTSYLSEENAATITGVIGFIVIVLRAITTGPIGVKK